MVSTPVSRPVSTPKCHTLLKSLPCCVFDHHHIFHVLLEKSSGAKEDVLEVVAVEGDDDLVSLEGGDHLVLLVDHIELDVARGMEEAVLSRVERSDQSKLNV